jgi:hypothetical protein
VLPSIIQCSCVHVFSWSIYSSPFIESKASLPCTKDLATGIYLHESSSCSYLIPPRPVLILLFRLVLGVWGIYCLSDFLAKILYAFIIFLKRVICLALIIILGFTTLTIPEEKQVYNYKKNTQYIIFFSLISLSSCLFDIFSSAPCSQIPSHELFSRLGCYTKL